MAEHAAKPWKCKNDHVMGQVFRNGSGLRRLALYRIAVDLTAADLEQVEVMAVVDGFVADIKCSICGCVRSWVPGEESIRELERKHREMMKHQRALEEGQG